LSHLVSNFTIRAITPTHAGRRATILGHDFRRELDGSQVGGIDLHRFHQEELACGAMACRPLDNQSLLHFQSEYTARLLRLAAGHAREVGGGNAVVSVTRHKIPAAAVGLICRASTMAMAPQPPVRQSVLVAIGQPAGLYQLVDAGQRSGVSRREGGPLWFGTSVRQRSNWCDGVRAGESLESGIGCGVRYKRTRFVLEQKPRLEAAPIQPESQPQRKY